MGFLRRLFGGGKKSGSCDPKPNKRLWSFVRSLNGKSRLALPSSQQYCGVYGDNLDPDKHAIAVAVATAAVAEAALAAAQAAAEVVRLTGGGRGGVVRGHPAAKVNRIQRLAIAEKAAAIKIQCAFRGYLARRALRALKALVKLQALARGYIVRKRMSDMLRRMQTLVRVQARARIGRTTANPHSTCSSLSHPLVSGSTLHPLYSLNPSASPQNQSLDELEIYSGMHLQRCNSNSNLRDNVEADKGWFGSNWLDRWMEESVRNEDERSTKILEVDTWKPSRMMNRDSPPVESPSKRHFRGKAETLRYFRNVPEVNLVPSRPGSSSSRRENFSPTKSECSWGGYLGHPSYMANTESSRAKSRSHSAPRQRIELDHHYRQNMSSVNRVNRDDGWPVLDRRYSAPTTR